MFRSPFPDETIPSSSVFDFLFGGLSDEDAARIALVDGPSGAETSYGELRQQILLFAGALAARGIAPGEVVALHSPNAPAFAVAFHGILRAGAAATTVNVLATAEEMARQLRSSHAKLVLTVGPIADTARSAAEQAGLPADAVLVLDAEDGLRAMLGEGRSAPEVTFDPATQVAAIPYSSGTTGFAKGVQLSHRNLVANVVQCTRFLDITADDRVLAFLPFFHIYGMTVLLNIALERRATLVTMPRFDLPQFLQLIQEQRITFVFIAPPVAVALAKHPLVEQYDLSSLRGMMSGAAPLDEALGTAVADRLGITMQQGYGMSELSPVSHVIPGHLLAELSVGSVGLLLPNQEAKIVDVDSGEEVEADPTGPSAPGELWVRGPNVMLGYLDDPESTARTIDADGFLHTGDIALVNPDGSFQIVDRLKELIKYKGYQVAPAELEALLLTHPEIDDAAVVAAADEEAGEIPKAFIVRHPGSEVDEETIMGFVAERVAPYKRVRAVGFIDAVPKSSSGKILRKDLKGK
ncbi:AMP-binding protein [Pseudolysinimonas sp.]|uniref:AMP-binding protein n=1 Tax=Pseudolysinimonas sp. TaxID=2680009 RepID=UPI003F80FCF4